MKTWAEVSARAGRNELPVILLKSFGELSDEEFRIALPQAWSGPEWPGLMLPTWQWLDFFYHATDKGGYLTDDGTLVPNDDLTDRCVTLWRGAHPNYAVGLSWTDDQDKAQWFATRLAGTTAEGLLWQVTVPETLVLARFTERNESEYVVDIDQLHEDDVEQIPMKGTK